MKKIFVKVASILATTSLFASTAVAPIAFAADTQEISFNGAGSTNTSTVTNTSTKSVVQSNNFNQNTTVTVSQDTGHVTADDNTFGPNGGSVLVSTGNNSFSFSGMTAANLNQAALQMGMPTGSTGNTLIAGNGAGSANTATQTDTRTASTYQDNTFNGNTAIAADQNSGFVNADRNTGNADITVLTGHDTADVSVATMANANIASGNGSTGTGLSAALTNGNGSGSYNTAITGNGADSTNNSLLERLHDSTLVQSNTANADTTAALTQTSGYATANDTTGGNLGGSVVIDTGNTSATARVANRGNLNVANSDSWLPTENSFTSGNGAGSTNSLASYLTDSNSVFQGSGNTFNADTALDLNPSTGFDNADRSTFMHMGGVAVISGHSSSSTMVSNTGNANFFGSTMPMVTLGFDMGSMFHSFGL